MGEVQAQDAEERRPAVGVPFKLVVPFIRACEPAVHHAHHAGSTGAGLDSPFSRDRPRPFFALNYETPWRIPRLDRRDRIHAGAETADSRAARAFLDAARHEPRRYALAGRDRAPHLLRRAGNLDFGLDIAMTSFIFLHRHDALLRYVRRCRSPMIDPAQERRRVIPGGALP